MSDTKLGCLFSQPWWLDAVSPGAWDAVEIERDGKMLARLPYLYSKGRLGLHLGMPMLTQTLGPWIAPMEGKASKRFGREKDLMFELISKLPDYAYFSQNFHYTITNWMPWLWKGFEQTTRYTYVLEDLSDRDALFQGFDTKIRGDIRKASKQVEVLTDVSLDEFLELNNKVFERQGISTPYQSDLVRRIDDACRERGCRKIFMAKDSQGRNHAAAYIIWNEESAYYLLGGSDPELRNSGATSLVLWESIKFASSVTKVFDFEGSMLEPVERYVRAFGGVPKPYFNITHSKSKKYRVKRALQKLIKEVKS
jgi:hypothetical protein